MTCILCRSPTGYFNSWNCKSGHPIHKTCIRDKKNHSTLTDCRSCILLAMKKQEDKVSHCTICNEKLKVSEKKCKIYKFICTSCQQNYTEKKHYKNCKTCKEKHLNNINVCNYCENIFTKGLTYNPPRCKSHLFCKNCLNLGEKVFKQCDSCQFYFKFLGKKIHQNESFCYLCGRFPEGKVFQCTLGHNYCKFCLQYLNKGLLKVFDRVKNCEFCLDKLTKYCNGESSEHGSIKQNSIKEDPEPPPEFVLNPISEEKQPEEIKMEIEPVRKVKKRKVKVNENILLSNSFYGQTEYCGTCKKNPGISLICGHFNCKICLGNGFMNDLMYIFALIDNFHYDRIPRQFQFTCITQGCRQKIHIPSQMIIFKVKDKMEPRHLNYYNVLSPYFDGIPMEIKLCSCNNLTLSSEFFHLFCTCNST